jgi:hypothetical protein
MTRTVLAVIASVLLSAGCAKRIVIPDPAIPHQVAEEAEIVTWCRAPDGKLVKCTVRLLEGWWVASPQVVEGDG